MYTRGPLPPSVTTTCFRTDVMPEVEALASPAHVRPDDFHARSALPAPTDILELAPQRAARVDALANHFDAGNPVSWNLVRHGLLNASAFLSAHYPPEKFPRVVFFPRDTNLIAGAFQLREPDLSRAQNVFASRVSIHAEHFGDYLAQQGIHEASLLDLARRGQKILLVDQGFNGTIPKAVAARFSPEARRAIAYHLVEANPASGIPGNDLFTTAIRDAGVMKDGNGLAGVYAAFRVAETPKSTPRTTDYVRAHQEWIPEFGEDPDWVQERGAVEGHSDTLSAAHEQALLQDLRFEAERPTTQRRLHAIADTVRTADACAQTGDRQGVLRTFAALRRNASEHGLTEREALETGRDWLLAHRLQPSHPEQLFVVSPEELGLPHEAVLYDNWSHVLALHPDWENPDAPVWAPQRKLDPTRYFEAGDLATLAEMAKTVEHGRFRPFFVEAYGAAYQDQPQFRPALDRLRRELTHEYFAWKQAFDKGVEMGDVAPA